MWISKRRITWGMVRSANWIIEIARHQQQEVHISTEDTDIPTPVDLSDLIVDTNTEQNETHEPYHDIDNHDPHVTIVDKNDISNNNQPATTSSGRRVNKPKQLDDYVVYETSVTEFDDTTLSFIDSIDPIALMTNGNQDNFYYHEILR
jgi:hypothetical protein